MAVAEVDYLNGGGGGLSISDFNASFQSVNAQTNIPVSDNTKIYLVCIQRNYSPSTEYYSAKIENGSKIVYHDSLPSQYYVEPYLDNGNLVMKYATATTPTTDITVMTITP